MSEESWSPDEAEPIVQQLLMAAISLDKYMKDMQLRLSEVETRMGLRHEVDVSKKFDF